jgi:hypothetical protein
MINDTRGTPGSLPSTTRKTPLRSNIPKDVNSYFSSFMVNGTTLRDEAVKRLIAIALKVECQDTHKLAEFRSLYDPDATGSVQRFWSLLPPTEVGVHNVIQWAVTTLESETLFHAVRDKILKCILSELIGEEEARLREEGNAHGGKYRTMAREATAPESENPTQWAVRVKRYDVAGEKWRKFEPGCLVAFGESDILQA